MNGYCGLGRGVRWVRLEGWRAGVETNGGGHVGRERLKDDCPGGVIGCGGWKGMPNLV